MWCPASLPEPRVGAFRASEAVVPKLFPEYRLKVPYIPCVPTSSRRDQFQQTSINHLAYIQKVALACAALTVTLSSVVYSVNKTLPVD
ncbi:hypothetical protein E2C01_059348 [Portunus trituberculatus]|uniref:Uncharacterized protein n=1 Tax=Portunus trituberculatus TaxID=210409 RepID=A0A5B7H5L1_PORTR|nr:hypothetical protein [Portunus trituberculatus]